MIGQHCDEVLISELRLTLQIQLGNIFAKILQKKTNIYHNYIRPAGIVLSNLLNLPLIRIAYLHGGAVFQGFNVELRRRSESQNFQLCCAVCWSPPQPTLWQFVYVFDALQIVLCVPETKG